MKEELQRNQSASTCENNNRYKKVPHKNARRVKIKESKELQEDLSKYIRKIMNFSLSEQFGKVSESENHEMYQDDCFLNPKRPEMIPNLSRMKQHFLKQYQDQFISEGIQEIHNHKHAVSNILYSGLSASALASAKWHSVQAMRRMRAERPQCPEFKEYPLDKEAIQEIEQTKNKVNYKRRVNSEHEKVNEKLMLDRSHSLNKYIENLKQSNQIYTNVYGLQKGEYDLILEFAKKQNISVSQAENDFQFIKSKKRTAKSITYHENRSQKRIQRRKYVDDDDVYGVRPNRISPSGVQLKNKLII
ncbi:unnamed protein product (macronuclear) [Paramecium tetraurelia]|uniref:Uncharacterized protein n=1 Tax=Paramecium tetraurelia TaxID=5888 RepID=A0DD27_PARTE|nr:uncharacterized protein GSPATT00015803001 [Paramecium tetraurelia]CAK80944.1 unnamed protein product [Paramecium tetraurelia]|eukprot:XP_001448341.1 hypothetical protein (macronuclear) [Paramecium tetraurelia strain d4-2]